MNDKISDDILKIRCYLEKARRVYLALLCSSDRHELDDKDKEKLLLAMRHRERCADRLFELYHSTYL